MVALTNVARQTSLLFSLALLLVWFSACTPGLIAPSEQNSSLIIGRVVVNNYYSGPFYGYLPIGVPDKGLEVEIEGLDGTQYQTVKTEEQGYFAVSNLSPNPHHVLRVTIESSPGRTKLVVAGSNQNPYLANLANLALEQS